MQRVTARQRRILHAATSDRDEGGLDRGAACLPRREIAGLPASRGTILRARGVDAQQIFMTATLMCVVWLTTLTMLVRQAQFTDFAANKASLVSGQSVARPIPPLSAHNH
jgi:hypothetical protein